MNVESATQLIDAVTRLIGVVVWPALVLFVLVRFAPSLKDFFASLGEISLKGVGFEATAKRRQAEAAAALVAASVSRPDTTSTPQAAARSARDAAAVVTRSVTARVIRRASDAKALWVDDDPDRNVFERQSLEALGLSFVLATSTDDALDRIAHQHFDVVISDLERPSDPQAGYTLLDRLRAAGDTTPVILYAGAAAARHEAEARRHGAVGVTDRASELFGYVLDVLDRAR